ncbi:HNH endonuclease [Mycobacterium sp. MYCO198283]|uniref:HNH endonuclease signature motif containing protein n=1 Tax=Mycobacterium sp. MYCO198283 TaxID=2883505 RepID=UPI001E3CA814|nr:HNH endonuclease signature motif containing protein [Mycobacterium sp. MYCO198283]MCG5431077.1 HNH endonuclease [Mycobacterium sp. MYCO198283]
MFERLPPDDVAGLDDAGVVSAISTWSAVESAAAARRLAAIAELLSRRGDEALDMWAFDGWDCAAAEVAAALTISHAKASSQLHLAVALRDRLPKVRALLAAGRLSVRVASTIAWRTALASDEVVGELDAQISATATRWGALSDAKLAAAIDVVIDRMDPAALRHSRTSARARDVVIGDRDDSGGLTSFWGRLYATDAEVLKRRLTAMVHGVCDDDGRTLRQRRADALGALAAGSLQLRCQCGNPACAAGAVNDGPAASVVVHVVAESTALAERPDPAMNGNDPVPDTTPAAAEPAAAEPPGGSPDESRVSGARPTAVLAGVGPIPTSLLAELIAAGATVRDVRDMTATSAEPRYTPSSALQDFVRARDLTCRFPGCDAPAETCDCDHTTPYPAGPTHPSGLKCLCRKHHLLKTFFSGPGGWRDEQHPDGTVVWTAPTGHTYTTVPGARLHFPGWNTRTGELPATVSQRPTAAPAGLTMPRRRRTRAADRARRTAYERSLNDALVAERNRPPPF